MICGDRFVLVCPVSLRQERYIMPVGEVHGFSAWHALAASILASIIGLPLWALIGIVNWYLPQLAI